MARSFDSPSGVAVDPPVRDVLGEARALRRSGRREEAAGVLRAALEGEPGSAAIHNELAVVLRELGRIDEAEAHFRRAAGLAPGFAPYVANLGQTQKLRGESAGAVESFTRSIRLAPGHAPFWRALGDALESLGRLDEAEAAYREAARLAPDLAGAHHDHGRLLVALGRLGEAIAPLERAAAIEPGNATHWENLAGRHERAGRFGPAIAAWERVLALDPGGRAYPHLALARALREEGRSGEAAAQFLATLAIEPGSVEARVELGSLRMERGEFAEAEAAYRGALAIEPTSSWGHAGLAWILRDRLPDADLAALEARLGDPDPEARIRLLCALATVLDASGQRADAVVRLREANALQMETNRSAGRGFDPAAHDRLIDDLIAAFGPAFFARTAGAGPGTRLPVFVVGLPRSGTTLIEQVLASHPVVHGAGELTLARAALDMLPGLVGRPGAPPSECASLLDAASILRLADVYLQRLHARGGRAERVVDKLPENALYLGLLHALFPKATFIHCRRDPRDTALSCWMTIFQGLNWTNDPAHIASVFRGHHRVMDHWRATLPATIHEVDYEEAVADLEGVARRLVSALGLPWDPACLEFHRPGRAVRTASAIQIRQPVHRRSVGRWRLYEAELADLFAAISPPDGPRRPGP